MSAVKLDLERLDAGWAVIVVQSGEAVCKIWASFVGGNDALENLVHLGASAKRSLPMEVWFEGEPQQWRIAVEPRSDGQVDLTVHWFRDRVKRQPADLGTPEFAAPCRGDDLARAIRNAFSAWQNEQQDYERRWHRPFPACAFGLLESAFA